MDWHTLPYALLGDDIAICDSQVAERYKLKCKELGVEFSTLKTHTSSNFFEFAKRMFLKGKEISPFPISALKESSKSSILLTQVLLEARKKDFPLCCDLCLHVSDYYSRVMTLRKRLVKKYYENSLLAETIMKLLSKDLDLQNDNLDRLIRHFNYPIQSLPLGVCESILSNCIVQEFANSNDPDKLKVGQPLGLLAQQLVMLWTSPDVISENETFGMDLIYSFPICRVYGQIEEKYLKLQKHAYSLDTTLSGNWFGEMRNLTIPKSDQIFTDRAESRVAYASARLGKLVNNQIQVAISYGLLDEFRKEL